MQGPRKIRLLFWRAPPGPPEQVSPPPSFTSILSALFLLLLLATTCNPCSASPAVPDGKDRPIVYLLYASAGTMPQLLEVGQIDAFLVWEPIVASTQLSGIGKMIATPSDLPPEREWESAASCVLVLDDYEVREHTEIAGLLSALTTAATSRIYEDPENAENITARWVYGTGPILTPRGTVDPLAVENLSFQNIVFTSNATLPSSGIVTNVLGAPSREAVNATYYTDDSVFPLGLSYLNGSYTPGNQSGIPVLNIGYLPSSDNFAPLYVMVMDSQYFCERYGFCLVPNDNRTTRPYHCTLMSGSTPVAKVNLVPGQSGGGLMTTLGQEALDGVYVGSVPAMMQIGLGNPASVIQSINSGGSGLVVLESMPCNNWTCFTKAARERSWRGKPLVIATVLSSIQEDMIRGALASENITVVMYGTDTELAYY